MYVVEYGHWDYRDWPADRLDEFWKYYERVVRLCERDAKLSGGEGMVAIIDFDDFQLTHYASSKGKIWAD